MQEVWHLLLDQIRRDLITINEQAGRGEYQAAKRGAETVAADLMRLARLYAAHHRNPPTTPTTTTPREEKP